MNAHLMMRLIFIFAIGRHKSIGRMVKDIEEAHVERQTGAEDGGQHNLVGRNAHLSNAERRGDLALFILQPLRHLKSLIFTQPLDVVAEKQPVLLIVFIANLAKVLSDDAVSG